jgi:hypothetical protein
MWTLMRMIFRFDGARTMKTESNQHAGGGCSAATCSAAPKRPTPLTDQWKFAVHGLEMGVMHVCPADLTAQLERDRDEARRIAKEACELLARKGYQVNFPPMPWEDSEPNSQDQSPPSLAAETPATD